MSAEETPRPGIRGAQGESVSSAHDQGTAISPSDEIKDIVGWLVEDEYDLDATKEHQPHQAVMMRPEGDPESELISQLRQWGNAVIWQSRNRHSRARALELAVELTEAGIGWEIWQVDGGTPLVQHLENGGSLEMAEGGIEPQRSWMPGESENVFLREDAITAREWAEAKSTPAQPASSAEPEDPTPDIATSEARKEFDALLARHAAETADMPGGKGSRYEGARKALDASMTRRWADAQTKRIAAAHEAAKLVDGDESDEDAIAAVLAGDDGAVPTFGHVAGTTRALFYEGTENDIFGVHSAGKSLIISHLHAEVLNAGGVVVHWEFDGHRKRDHFRRLKNAGVDISTINGRFHLLKVPDHATASSVTGRVDLVTLDALNPAIVLLGLDPDKPVGTDTVLQTCMRPFTGRGAVGIVLDHVGHENQHRQTGSKRKMDAFQGAVYRIEVSTPLAPGQEGVSKLVLAKCNKGGAGIEGHVSAVVRMTPAAGLGEAPGAVKVTFEQYDAWKDTEPSERQPDETDPEKYARLLKAYGAERSITVRDAKALLKKHGAGVSGKHITEGMRLFRETFDHAPEA